MFTIVIFITCVCNCSSLCVILTPILLLQDAPLAPEGITEAKEAGRLLKAHGFEFDVVYTSWLSRAIDTAWLVLDEMDCLWLPIIKSWRLNERM